MANNISPANHDREQRIWFLPQAGIKTAFRATDVAEFKKNITSAGERKSLRGVTRFR